MRFNLGEYSRKNKGKTYTEIYGKEKATILCKIRSKTSNHNKGMKFKKPINKQSHCKFCKQPFLSAHSRCAICSTCAEFITLVCCCGCNEIFKRQKYTIRQNYPILKQYHYIKTKAAKPTKLEHICKYCFTTFLAKDIKAAICSTCNTKIEVYCACGCNSIISRTQGQLKDDNIYKTGHRTKGKTYEQIYGISLSRCGFRKGELNVNNDPIVKQKQADKHALNPRQSSLERKLIPYLSKWNQQYQIDWYCVDFALPSEKKVIEVNGCYWHCCASCGYTAKYNEQKQAVKKDKAMKTYLENREWTIEIIWEHDVDEWINARKEAINDSCNKIS